MKKWLESDVGRSVLTMGALALILVLGGMPGEAGSVSRDVVATVKRTGFNEADEKRAMDIYYNQTLEGDDDDASPFGIMDAGEGEEALPEGWIPIEDSDCVTYAHDDPFLIYVLKPNYTSILKGATNTTNRWGMRDKDYEQKKPEGTFRIALCGASNDMGSGVEYEQSFAYLVEERLNKELAGKYYDHFEVVNFSVGGYFMLERTWLVEEKAPEFEPDLIIFTILEADRTMLHNRLARRLVAKPNLKDLHYDFLKQRVKEAGIRPADLPKRVLEGEDADRVTAKFTKLLHPLREKLLIDCLEEMHRFQESSGIPVASMILHREPGMKATDYENTMWVERQCRKAGFHVLPIYKAYEKETEGMLLHPLDRHPSVKGHALLTEDILEQLTTHPVIGAMLRKE